MKNILKVTITFLVLTIMIASVSFATGLNTIEMEEDQKEILNLMKDPIDNDVLDKMNTINSDVFISEENISVEENVNGNLYLIGEVINISSENIDGNVFVLGNNVSINSNIEGSVYALATNLTIYGNVEDIYAIAENMSVLENTNCRDLKVVGANLNMAGTINRDAHIIGGQAQIEEKGKVNGVLTTSKEVLGNSLNVNEIKIVEDVTADFEKSEAQMEKIGESVIKGIALFLFISSEMTGLIIIAIIVIFASKKSIQTSNLKEKGFLDTIYGLVYYFITVGIIIALMITIIGIPVALFLAIVLWFIFWKITLPVASIEITKAILQGKTKSKVLVWFVAFIIFTLVQCANFIPTVGGLIKGLVSLYGFGYIIGSIIRKNKSEDSESAIEILE